MPLSTWFIKLNDGESVRFLGVCDSDHLTEFKAKLEGLCEVMEWNSSDLFGVHGFTNSVNTKLLLLA